MILDRKYFGSFGRHMCSHRLGRRLLRHGGSFADVSAPYVLPCIESMTHAYIESAAAKPKEERECL